MTAAVSYIKSERKVNFRKEKCYSIKGKEKHYIIIRRRKHYIVKRKGNITIFR